MSWPSSLSIYVLIFCVGRGNAAFVRSGLNQGFILDMGKSEDFNPAEFIEKNLISKLSGYTHPQEEKKENDKSSKIAQAVLSHPHIDHISQCENIMPDKKLYASLLTCPHDKEGDKDALDEKLNWERIENPGNSEGLIEIYKGLYGKKKLPLQTICFDSERTIPNLEYGIFYIRPPICEDIHENDNNKYGNCTSIMFYFRHGDHSILFPGDMTPEGMKYVLDEEEGVEKRFTKFDSDFKQNCPNWEKETNNQPGLKSLLETYGLTMLIAPHHGLESCYSEDLFEAIDGGKPQLVVISERRHKIKEDGKVHQRYQSEDGASGILVDVEGKKEKRKSLSTVNGHHILMVFPGTGQPKVYAHKNPQELLKIINE